MKGVHFVLHMNRWSWNETICTNFLNSSEWSWDYICLIGEGLERSQFAPISLISPKWSWKESVCVATLLVALVLAVLSMLYGDVLLYLWPLCIDCLGGWEHLKPLQWCPPPVDLSLLGFPPMVLKEFTPGPWSASGSWSGLSALFDGLERSCCLCLGCTGDILMGSMVNSSLLRSIMIFLLSVGVSLGGWGHWGCLSTGCMALCGLGWISPVVQVLLMVSPSPHLGLISFIKWNLEHLLVPFCCPSLDPFVKGLERNQSVVCFLYGLEINFLVPLLSMVLKEICLVPLLWMVLKEVALLICVLKGNLFPHRLTHGLERSLSASIFDHPYHWLCWHYPFLWWLLCHLHQWSWKDLTCICLLSPASCIFGWGLERSLSACAPSHGLERTGWMVLKGLRCNSLVPQSCFAIYF